MTTYRKNNFAYAVSSLGSARHKYIILCEIINDWMPYTSNAHKLRGQESVI